MQEVDNVTANAGESLAHITILSGTELVVTDVDARREGDNPRQ
jgi:hypothetical protein